MLAKDGAANRDRVRHHQSANKARRERREGWPNGRRHLPAPHQEASRTAADRPDTPQGKEPTGANSPKCANLRADGRGSGRSRGTWRRRGPGCGGRTWCWRGPRCGGRTWRRRGPGRSRGTRRRAGSRRWHRGRARRSRRCGSRTGRSCRRYGRARRGGRSESSFGIRRGRRSRRLIRNGRQCSFRDRSRARRGGRSGSSFGIRRGRRSRRPIRNGRQCSFRDWSRARRGGRSGSSFGIRRGRRSRRLIRNGRQCSFRDRSRARRGGRSGSSFGIRRGRRSRRPIRNGRQCSFRDWSRARRGGRSGSSFGIRRGRRSRRLIRNGRQCSFRDRSRARRGGRSGSSFGSRGCRDTWSESRHRRWPWRRSRRHNRCGSEPDGRYYETGDARCGRLSALRDLAGLGRTGNGCCTGGRGAAKHHHHAITESQLVALRGGDDTGAGDRRDSHTAVRRVRGSGADQCGARGSRAEVALRSHHKHRGRIQAFARRVHDQSARHKIYRNARNGGAIRVHPGVRIHRADGELRIGLQLEQNAGGHFDDNATIMACGDHRTFGQSFPDFRIRIAGNTLNHDVGASLCLPHRARAGHTNGQNQRKENKNLVQSTHGNR